MAQGESSVGSPWFCTGTRAPRQIVADVEGVEIFVASIDDLIELKRVAGRPKDLEDIRVLRQLKGGAP